MGSQRNRNPENKTVENNPIFTPYGITVKESIDMRITHHVAVGVAIFGIAAISDSWSQGDSMVEKKEINKTFSEMAVVRVQVAGAPRASDVCLSSRWKHPRNAEDPYDTFVTGDAFHATRLDWVYSTDAKWIGECRKRGYSFGATVNSKIRVKGDTNNEKGRLRNKKGERITAPWMRKWESWWGCVNAPSFRKAFLEQATQALDAGAAVIHVDDPGINATAGRWGACYCEHCKAKAKAEGVDLNRKMGAFQRASVEAFYKDFRQKIDKHTGRHVAVSSNNYGGAWGWPYSLFDYGIGEFKSHTPGPLYKAILDARKHKKNQVFTLGSYVRLANQYAIATTYAMGAHLLVPWDVWIPNSPRVYGKPQEYAHFYGFVRAMPEYLDGYGEAFATGYDLPKPGSDLVTIDGEKAIALVRAKPGDAKAPVVIHVVDYTYRPYAGRRLTVSKSALGFGDKIKATLYTPVPYNKALHEKVNKAAEALRGDAMRGAAQAKAFEPLRKAQPLEIKDTNGTIVITLPKFGIWGIVVIENDRL